MKRLSMVIICLVLIIISITGCADKVWEETDEFENGGRIIVSPEGIRYYCTSYRHIVGFKTDKKIGLLPNYPNSKKGARVCSIKDADSDMYIAVQDIEIHVEWEIGPEYHVYIKSGEEIDYTSTDISEVVFIPMNELVDDYSQYIENHGLFGDEAKSAMKGAYDDEGDFAINEYVGKIVYSLDGIDWCYFMSSVRYSYDGGFFTIMNGKGYLLPDNTIKALGISL